MYTDCRLCPRNCGVDRSKTTGFCKMPDKLLVARASAHMWEEPCISGDNGSGTVFFSGCSLRCVYCQNFMISRGNSGKEITIDRLSDIFLELQESGVHNINLVTPDHYTYHIIKALESARTKGLFIPVVYNTSGYSSVDTLRMYDGLVDIYLTDFKYATAEISEKYSGANDYPECATKALSEMNRQIPKTEFKDSLMKKGIIVRHLVLPGNVKESKSVLKYLFETYGNKLYYSIMNQYTPNGLTEKFPELSRRLRKTEYERVILFAEKLGIENAYIQEGETALESFIPSFDNTGV